MTISFLRGRCTQLHDKTAKAPKVSEDRANAFEPSEGAAEKLGA